MPPVIPVGIDLGTSFCAVSYIDADGCSQMISGPNGDILTPSIIHFGDEQITVGDAAWNAALLTPERLAESAKRDMGVASYRQPINGQNYPPEVIQSCLLRRLRDDVIAAVGENYQAVITVPAYFDEARRKTTCDAALMSGLPVLDIVNEPTAAALAFGERLGFLTPEGAPSECLNVVVYDLGGGTFDVTVIRLAAGEFRTLATDGDYELGGINWDQRLADLATSRFRAIGLDLGSERIDEMRLRRAAQEAKHALTESPATMLELVHGDQQLKAPITREEFEDETADLLERTVFTTKQAVQAAGLLWSDIDRLILVGGSSRMPAVQRALKELTGLPVDSVVNPDEAVARGAAVFARYLLGQRGLDAAAPRLQITDVNAHSLGIEGVNLQTLRAENVTLIPRNTPLPCEIKRSFVTRSDGQPNVKILLLEGESSVPGNCSQLATATIRNLPPGLPKGTPIDVRYSLQPNGRLSVTAAIPTYGEDAQIELQRVRGLAERRVRKWKKIVCRNGGFRDFQDALAQWVDPQEPHVDSDADDDHEIVAAPTKADFVAAVPFGAPQAAADVLRARFGAHVDREHPAVDEYDEALDESSMEDDLPSAAARRSQQPRARRAKSSAMAQLISYIVGAVVGLALGYYVLRWLRPDLSLSQSNASVTDEMDLERPLIGIANLLIRSPPTSGRPNPAALTERAETIP